LKVEEVHVPANSPFIGRPVKDVDFKTIGNLMLISARKKSGEWVYNPYPDTIMEGDMSLIIIATPEEKELLIEHISGGSTFPGRSPLP